MPETDSEEEENKQREEEAEERRMAILRRWGVGLLTRRRCRGSLKKGEIYRSFGLQGDKQAIYVIVQRFKEKGYYQYCIFNMFNKRTRSDTLFVRARALPRGLNDGKEYDVA